MTSRDELGFDTTLRNAGLRVTRPRIAVLLALHGHPHADTSAVIDAIRDSSAGVSHQAVYDSLHTLTDAGLVRRIQPAGSSARYELRTGDNHHHAVCRTCGLVTDIDCLVGETPCLRAADDQGFTIAVAEVTYWGECPACKANLQENVEPT